MQSHCYIDHLRHNDKFEKFNNIYKKRWMQWAIGNQFDTCFQKFLTYEAKWNRPTIWQ